MAKFIEIDSKYRKMALNVDNIISYYAIKDNSIGFNSVIVFRDKILALNSAGMLVDTIMINVLDTYEEIKTAINNA
ncbi:hypothetical protein [Dysgonomonas capnocytophagoides]|uniref:hypothetical protein n=1 Tax=Dysgonomonas capnocytophagoides TaxID=45254 RepID=UPI0030C852F2